MPTLYQERMTSSNMSIFCGTFIIFLLLGCISVTDSTNDIDISEHLCTKIANGNFDRIYIKSITVLSRVNLRNHLIIFEDNKMHQVELSRITNVDMEMNLNEHQWNKDFMDLGVSELVIKKRFNVSEMNAVYFIYNSEKILDFDVKFEWQSGEYRLRSHMLVAMVFTNETVYLMDILSNIDLFNEYTNKFPRSFALLQYQPSGVGKGTIGFVIHKDIYSLTDQLVMYDMEYHGMFRLKIHKKRNINDEERRTAQYYYLEKSSLAGNVDLVPRRARGTTPQGDPSAQLVGNSVPRGFLLNGNLYLLDSQAGCVYVIGGNIATIKLNNEYTEKPNTTLTFPAVGIPFEKFFKCRGVSVVHPFPHPAGRCVVKRTTPPIRRPLAQEESDPISVILLLLLVLFLLTGLCVGGWCFFYGQSHSDAASGTDIDLKMITGLKMRLKQIKTERSRSLAAVSLSENSTLRKNSKATSNNSFADSSAKSTE